MTRVVVAPSASDQSRSPIQRFVHMPQVGRRTGLLGIAWFAGVVVCAAVGPPAIAVLFGGLASVAALQSAAVWRAQRVELDRQVVAFAPLLGALCALLGVGLAGAAVILLAVAAVVMSAIAPRRRVPVRSRAGFTMRCALVPMLTAVAVTLIARTSISALLVLLVLVSAYEVANHLMGTDAGSIFEGPIAGIVTVLVLTFTLATFQFGPFSNRSAWFFGGLVAVTVPFGPAIASALVPAARDAGAALRRLDSWILVAPVWCWLLWNLLGRTH